MLIWKLSWPLLWLWDPPMNIASVYYPMFAFLQGVVLFSFSLIYSPNAICNLLNLACKVHASYAFSFELHCFQKCGMVPPLPCVLPLAICLLAIKLSALSYLFLLKSFDCLIIKLFYLHDKLLRWIELKKGAMHIFIHRNVVSWS